MKLETGERERRRATRGGRRGASVAQGQPAARRGGSAVVRIGLFMAPTVGYFADVIAGVQEAASTRPNWLVEICPSYTDALETLQLWRPHGFLFDAASSDQWKAVLMRSRRPALQVGGQQVPGVPRISTDNQAIGRMAAEHFLARGFRSFAFCGYTYLDWSLERREGFRQALAEHGLTPREFPNERVPLHVRTVDRELRVWIESLEKPVGIFACHDRSAMLVGKACELAGIRVPEKVAIVGVDNNVTECLFTSPPLSSIMGSARRIGYEAALLLEQMMAGRAAPEDSVQIPPAGVEVRASSDALAITEPDLVSAMQFIHQKAGENISVADVAEAVLVSRRRLERMFNATLRRSPRSEIVRAHVERAKKLLVSTGHSALVVALESGFPSSSKFCTVFRRETGLAPIAFRRRYGVRGR